MNLGGLTGLSATYPGFQQAVSTDLENQKTRFAAEEAQNKLLAQQVLGRAFGGFPGAQPMAPPPGQASVPRQPAPPQMGAPPPSVSPAGGPPAGAAPQQPMGEVDLKTLTQRIIQTNPGIAGHPAVLMAALERAAPILDRQSREDLAEMRKEMSTQRLSLTAQLARERLDALERDRAARGERSDRRLDQAERKQESLEEYRKRTGDQRDIAEINKNGRLDKQLERTDRRLDQNDARASRAVASTKIKEDQGYQRLELQRQDLERKVHESGDKQALAAWRIVVNEQANRARAIINSNSSTSALKDADRKALLADVDKTHNEVIAAMKARIGGGAAPAAPAPGPQPAPPVAQPPAPATPAPPAAAPPAAAPQAPPAAMLKPGVVTTFANGLKFTLGPDGQPKQVP